MEKFSYVAMRVYGSLLMLFRALLPHVLTAGKRKAVPRIKERLRTPYLEKDIRNDTVVWLHAASLGESKLLFQFMDILKSVHPEYLFLLTATSETGVEYLRKWSIGSVCGTGYLPLDNLKLMRTMLTKVNVSRVWLMETELWPSLLWACREADVPVGIANARIEERSFQWYRRFAFLFSPLFEYLGPVLAQDEAYAERFTALGVAKDNVVVAGNLKSRVTVRRPAIENWRSLRENMRIDEHTTVVTFGCVHAGEVEEIRRAVETHREKPGAYKWIVVPRHLEDSAKFIDELGSQTVHVHDTKVPCDWQVCLVEKYGVLEDMYRIADVAFIGGTFIPVGGHNVWEAAQFGIPVFFGPHYHSQRVSCERLRQANVAFPVENGRELSDCIDSVLRREARTFIASQAVFIESLKKDYSSLRELVA